MDKVKKNEIAASKNVAFSQGSFKIGGKDGQTTLKEKKYKTNKTKYLMLTKL